MTLRTRLVLAAAYLLVVVVIAFEVPVAVTIDRRGVTELRAEILKQTAVAAAHVGDPLAQIGASGSSSDDAAIGTVVTSTASQTGARVVIVDRAGRVVADSTGEAGPGTLYATADRPEFAAALDGRVTSSIRHSNTVGGDLVVATVPVWNGQTSWARSEARRRSARSVRTCIARGSAWRSSASRSSWWGSARLAPGHVPRPAGAGARPRRRRPGRRRPGRPRDARGSRGDRLARRVVQPHGGGARLTVRSQRDFVANASHQLRTPLTGLRLRLEAVQAEGGPAAEEAGKALAEVDRLSALVDDLLRLQSATAPGASGSGPIWPRPRATRWTAGTARPSAPA